MIRQIAIRVAVLLVMVLSTVSVVWAIDEPVQAEFIGSGWLAGTSGSREVEVLLPYTDAVVWGVDRNGLLVNVSSTTQSGVMYINGTRYTFRAQSWSYPEYRAQTSASQYQTIYITPHSGNLMVHREYPSTNATAHYWRPILIGLLGVIVWSLILYKR